MSRNPYTNTDTVAAGDKVALWRPNAGDWYSASVGALNTYLQTLDAVGVRYVTQYAAPSASPATIAVATQTTDIWLVITPTGTIADLTITLPAPGSSYDKQHVSVNCTQAITALTVAGNGATAVTGEPVSMTANDFFTLRYDAVTSTWYRVG